MPDMPASPPVDTPRSSPQSVVPAPSPVVPSPSKPAVPAPQVSQPGPAKTKALEALRKMASDNPIDEEGNPVVAPPEPPKPEPTKPNPVPPNPEDKPSDVPPPGEKPELDAKGKPLGPWQLKEKWMKEAKKWEGEYLKLKETHSKVGDVSAIQKRAEAAEAKAKELAEEIRYANYIKSDEFKKSYQEPYENKWKEVVDMFKELTVTLEDGSTRPGNTNDLLAIFNQPLGEARKIAKQLFGEDLANDVMVQYHEVRKLAGAQQKAVEDGKKTAAEREQQLNEVRNKVATETGTLWEQFKGEDENKYEFLKSKEGDDEWNSKLESSKRFVDSVFATSATDPKLTSEQRAEAVRKHAAVRGRAIAFTMMKLENARMRAEKAEMQKVIDGYKQAEPQSGNGRSGALAEVKSGDAMSNAKAKLRAYIK